MEGDSPRVTRVQERGPLAPVYYLFGDDEYRKDEELKRLTEDIVEPATRDFNFDTFRGAEVNPEWLESLLHTPPLMARQRCVVVRDTASLKKESRATVERYVEHPAPDTVLLLVALAGTKEEKTFSSRARVVEVQPLGGVALDRWMTDHARAVHGSLLEPQAAAALQRTVGANSVQLAVELDKLASYSSGAPITETMVDEVVGERETKSLGDLLDAVAARDLSGALVAVDAVLSQPRANAVTVIMALTVQTLALWWGFQARARGVSVQRLSGEYFTLLKETGAYPSRSWSDAVRTWTRHLPQWDREGLVDGLRALRAADQSAKDTRLASDEQLLSSLVCALCAPSLVHAAPRA